MQILILLITFKRVDPDYAVHRNVGDKLRPKAVAFEIMLRRFKSEVQHSVSEPLSTLVVMTTTRNTVQRSRL
jgi:hypothetical protein